MANEYDEDLDYVGAFTEQFGSLGKAQKRLADERRAGRTKKQRKPSIAKKQMNIRASDETHDRVARLLVCLKAEARKAGASEEDVDKTVILEEAIKLLANSKGIP